MNTHRKSQFPIVYHGNERPRVVRRRFWGAFVLILALIALIVLIGRMGADTRTEGAQLETAASLSPFSTSWKNPDARAEFTAPVGSARDFHRQDGTYLVGTEQGQIAPGLYSATEHPGAITSSYFALCNDLMCLPGPGMDVSVIVHGQTYIVVKPDTFAVRLKGLMLTSS